MTSKERETIAENFQPAFMIAESSINNGKSNSPIIFSSPHSGRIYPTAFLNNSRLSSLQLRSSEDAYVDELFAHVTDQGASLIHSLVPRAYLDLNRHPYELDPKLFKTQLPAFAQRDTQKVKNGLGVIARIVCEGCEIYHQSLDLDEALLRIKLLYFPFHSALRTLIEEQQKKYNQIILIDCHSMPSTSLPTNKHAPPDFVLGNLFDKSCDYELTHLVRSQLQSMGYNVFVNKPYAGGFVTKEYGSPPKGVHALQIEINRQLYLNEQTLEKTSGFNELRENLRKLTKKLIDSYMGLSLGSSLAAE